MSTQDAIENTATSCLITRGEGGTKAFFGVNTFLQVPFSLSAYKTINSEDFLDDRIDACSSLNSGLDVNFIIVDFWHVGDLLQVVQTRNANLVPSQARKALRN